MTPCFADSSYFLALLIPGDANHENAQRLARCLRRPVVSTEFVLVEVGSFLSAQRNRAKFGVVLYTLQQDPDTEIVPLSSELFRRGCDLYFDRRDKAWSITDSISFTVMGDRGITDALTADHHFEQAGFVALLKRGP